MENKYDSACEQTFHATFPHLQLVGGTSFVQQFYDNDGIEFKAKPDFYCAITGLTIELKSHKLNMVKTKADSSNKQSKLIDYRGSLTNLDLLSTGWNHSLFKQAEVCSKVDHFTIVFADSTELTTYNKNRMKENKLNWMYAKDYQNLLNQALPKLLH